MEVGLVLAIIWVGILLSAAGASAQCYQGLCPGPFHLPNGHVGSPYMEFDDGTSCDCYWPEWAVVYWNGGSVPPGTTFSDGYYNAFSVTGTPTKAGRYTFSVLASDICWADHVYEFVIDIDTCPAITLTPPSTTLVAYEGIPYQLQITASGTPPHRFMLTDTCPPYGFHLSSSGLLTGTATYVGTGIYGFRVQAEDANGCAGFATYQMDFRRSLCHPLHVDPLPSGTAMTPYDQVLSARGGYPPYSFSLVAGGLPPGLSLSSSGHLTGTPTAAGAFSALLDVGDSLGCRNSVPLQMRIQDRVSLAAGPGFASANNSEVRVFSTDGSLRLVLTPYATASYGANASAGDFDGTNVESILTGPGPGPVLGPHVRCYLPTGSPVARINFFAYGTRRYGVLVSAPNLDDESMAEIVTGAGAGPPFGPHVRGFDDDGHAVHALPSVNFYAYSTKAYGVNIATGDVDGDFRDEILTAPGPGPGFGAQVRGFNVDGGPAVALPGLDFVALPSLRFGATVAAGDIDGDQEEEIAAGAGPDPSAAGEVRGFRYDGVTTRFIAGYSIVPFATLYGVRISLADLDRDGDSELVAGAGPDPSADSTIRGYRYFGGTLGPAGVPFLAFPTSAYGVNPATGHIGL